MKYLSNTDRKEKQALSNISKQEFSGVIQEEIAEQTGFSPLEVATNKNIQGIDYTALERKMKSALQI